MIHIHEEAARCLLCADAPCTKVCTNGDPARAIRAILFDNEALAEQWVESVMTKNYNVPKRLVFTMTAQ